MRQKHYFRQNTVCSEQKFTPKNKYFTRIISVHPWQIACLNWRPETVVMSKSWSSHEQVMSKSWASHDPESCRKVAWKLQERCEKVARKMPESCQKVARKLPESCQKVARKLPENCQKIARKFGFVLKTPVLFLKITHKNTKYDWNYPKIWLDLS